MKPRNQKSKVERLAAERGLPIKVRLEPDMLAALDAPIVKSLDPKTSRPEAVRQVLAVALNVVARDGAGAN